ncbi:hypothetical protein Cgig2_025271 [Carnegiea gigantea]|uniref:Uncharacterized protein n=1 Tax=Carnegiea gigantea TaxID=171969 RepID=A0A9Q1KBZ2_9CARY|nr:hypothetical protein Cgig2_025271 [Carnegiea gigantea]
MAKQNFKGDFLVKLESMLNEKFASYALKAYPHIDSKTKIVRNAFSYFDELDKVFDPDRAIGVASKKFEEAVTDLQNETIELDKDEEDDEDEEEEGKGKKKASHCAIVDLTSSFNHVFSNLITFINDMNSHLSTITSALRITQQHEQELMNCEMKLDDLKKGLFMKR